MTAIYGVALIALAVGMIFIGRPAKGMDSASFLKIWIVGQAYIVATIICLVMGTSLIIQRLPG
jgi:hypothetical protein